MSFKPSPEEIKWAKQLELDKTKQLKEDIMKTEVIETLRDYEPKCPKHNTKLEIKELDGTGIYVNTCPYCGGIWITRRNVEKLYQSTVKADKLITYLAKILNIEVSEI